MGDNDCNKAGYTQENGFVPVPGETLLCQVHSARGSGPDAWTDRGPEGMFYQQPTPGRGQ
jgi:hypothetical protein